MGGHSGSWWPIYVPDFYGSRCSQHPFDPYSFTHILHGFVFYFLLVTIPDFILDEIFDVDLPEWWPMMGGAAFAIVLEIGWEIFENSEVVLARFRSASGTSGLDIYTM